MINSETVDIFYFSNKVATERLPRTIKLCPKEWRLFFVSKVFLIYLTNSIDFTYYQNTLRRVIWGYIYTFSIKIRIKDKIETWAKFCIY